MSHKNIGTEMNLKFCYIGARKMLGERAWGGVSSVAGKINKR